MEIDVNEIVKNPEYIEILKKTIVATVKKRQMRPSPPNGMKYKRDWYDKFNLTQLNSGFFLENIISIWDKRSTLRRNTRNVIMVICNNALNEYVESKKPKIKKIVK